MIFQDLVQALEAATDFFAGFYNFGDVVDDARSHEDHKFCALLGFGAAAEDVSDHGDLVEAGDSRSREGIRFRHDASDGDGIAVLHSDLGLYAPLRKRRGLDSRTGCGRDGRADLLIDQESDDAAGEHAGSDIEIDTGVTAGDLIGKQGIAALLEATGNGLAGKGRHLLADVDAGGDIVGSNDLGSVDDFDAAFVFLRGEVEKQLSGLADEEPGSEIDAGSGRRTEDLTKVDTRARAAALEEGLDSGRECAGETDFINTRLNENLSWRDVEATEEPVDLVILWLSGLDQECVVKGIGDNFGDARMQKFPIIIV